MKTIFAAACFTLIARSAVGAPFSVDVSTLYVSQGQVGVATSSPAATLDVNGNAQFGAGATRSTFTAAGLLQLTPFGIQWADGSTSTTAVTIPQTFAGETSFLSTTTFGSGATISTFTSGGLLMLTAAGIQWADGSVSTTAITIPPGFASLSATQTFSGANSFLSTATFGSGATISTFTNSGLLILTSAGIQWADGSISTTAITIPSGFASLSATQTFGGANNFLSTTTFGSGAAVSTFTNSGLLNLTAAGIKWADGTTSTTAVTNSGVGTGSPSWTKYTKVYSDFSTAATSNSITLFAAAAGTVIHGVKIRHTTPFSGGSISAYTISVGTTSANGLYASAFDVFQSTNGRAFQLSNDFSGESSTAAWNVNATATSTGANLSAATGGSVDIWVLTSVAN